MKIPESLIVAKIAVEKEYQRRGVLARTVDKIGIEGATALSRIDELEGSVEKLHGELLADEALSGVADDLRMTAEARADAAKRLSAARAELEALQQTALRSKAGTRALQAISADDSEFETAAGRYLKGVDQFSGDLCREFHRDVIRLPLPALFARWFAIASGFGHLGIIECLNELKILPLLGGAILAQGQYYDPDTGAAVDFKAAWRTDPALVALNKSLAELMALKLRVASGINRRNLNRARLAEAEKLREQRRRMAAPQRHSTASTVTEPPPAPPEPTHPPLSETYSFGGVGRQP
ncbi:MAG TPA: hypothetical protein VFC38_05670 [Stellaceae bacterium]|nr:hypothetical protein [Stellaceae bacterium]